MLAQPSERPLQPRRALLGRACERASRFGVWLLPVLYILYFLALALFCGAPANVFWLPAAGTALAGAMGFGAVVFGLASRTAPVQEAGRTGAPPLTASRESGAKAREFARMPTRICVQTCQTPSGTPASFSIACYKAQCPSGQDPAEAPVIFRPHR